MVHNVFQNGMMLKLMLATYQIGINFRWWPTKFATPLQNLKLQVILSPESVSNIE